MFCIITPGKNESENLKELMKCLISQSRVPDFWIFVNDNSTDNTEMTFFNSIKELNFDDKIEFIYTIYPNKSDVYQLGEHYSGLILFAMNIIKEIEFDKSVKFEYIGILDCDIRLPENYYSFLLKELELVPNLGIVSAGTQVEEKTDGSSFKSTVDSEHCPGGFRVWKSSCLDSTGYSITVSQDAVSEARAIMLGWQIKSFPNLTVTMRARGSKFGYDYYGRSAYQRHIPFWIVVIQFVFLFFQGRRISAKHYVSGYLSAKSNGLSKISDPLAILYFKTKFRRKMKRYFGLS